MCSNFIPVKKFKIPFGGPRIKKSPQGHLTCQRKQNLSLNKKIREKFLLKLSTKSFEVNIFPCLGLFRDHFT